MYVGDTLCAWSRTADSVLRELRVEASRGLDDIEASDRLRQFGANELLVQPRRGIASILLSQLRSVVVLLLLMAMAFSLATGNAPEAVAIFVVVIINTCIGFLTEWRATRSMEALGMLAKVSCTLLREGVVRKAPAEVLVPGDIVMLAAGDVVPADLRVLDAGKLSADEAALTGESMPVTKRPEVLDEQTVIFERRNMLYKGTHVTRGQGTGVVVATGLRTEFGKIFDEVSRARPQHTPLEKRLDELGKRLAWVVLVIGLLLAGAGILAGRDAVFAVKVATALAVAAIPEGLPIVATIALARGLWRMAKRNALVTRLSAVETLGATSVILTDKTGTLTESRMVVTTALLPGEDLVFANANGDQPLLDEMLSTAVLCNDASLQKNGDVGRGAVGEPTENALLEAAAKRDIWREDLLQTMPEVAEDPFDPETKHMATAHKCGDELCIAVKGAPEVVIDYCNTVSTASGIAALDDNGREDWLRRVEGLCSRGLRTIAVARKRADSGVTDFYSGLTLLGVFGMEDPPRKGIADAITSCRDAGIAVIMVTGDHCDTATNVARRIRVLDSERDPKQILTGRMVDEMFAADRHKELLDARVFSRVTPAQKLRLIRLHQEQGQVVAMTGDGVNDAPALRKADIGVAMGVRGTAVAREAAEMVLQDDDFGTIVVAIRHGRAIFENIRKFVVYLLSCNTSEILVVSLATIVGAPLPLLPLQILFLNLVTDVFPALALGVGPPRPGLMRARPRPASERILPGRCWLEIVVYGIIMAIATLGAMLVAVTLLKFDLDHAITIAFGTLAFAQMLHVFNMRGEIGRMRDNEITRNPWIWLALAICLALVLAAIYVPVLAGVLHLHDPGPEGWALVVAASVIPLLLAPVVRRTRRAGDGADRA